MKKRRIPWGFFDRACLILFNILLLVVSIMAPALVIASTPEYYYSQFEKNGIYSTVDEDGNELRNTIYYIDGNRYQVAQFSDDQLDGIADHIVEYLFGDEEEFTLIMDDVCLNGVVTDGVSIFGEVAVVHMAAVKMLLQFAIVFAVVGGVVLLALVVYFILRKREMRGLFLKYTLCFYLGLLSVAALFCLVTLVTKEPWRSYSVELWRNLHYLFFPFQPEKVEGSFFSDTLTEILTLELFLTAVNIVLLVVLLTHALWLGGIFLLRRKSTARPISLELSPQEHGEGQS